MTRTSYFVLLVLAAQIPASETATSSGKNFTVVFPENIAYFDPLRSNNTIWVTGLHADTTVSIRGPSELQSANLSAGETRSFKANRELGKPDPPADPASDPFRVFSVSDQTFTVTATKDVVVQAVSSRRRSVQSALILPADKLQLRYFVPPAPDAEEPQANVTERAPFRVVVVNPGPATANVSVGGGAAGGMLEAEKAAQVWVSNDEAPLLVQSDQPVAVFFSHACAAQANCTCGLLHAAVPPAREEPATFPVPPHLARHASVLLSDQDARTSETIKAEVRSAGTALLYRPDRGLLLTLIPEEEFASCFLVPFLPDRGNAVTIVVRSEHKDGVHVGAAPLDGADWEELPETPYVSTSINATAPRTVVWHAFSKMAVYHVAWSNGSWFGNPAAAVGASPDFRGCAVTPEEIKVLNETESWQQSVASCEEEDLQLLNLSSEQSQRQICGKLQQSHGDVREVWIASRRSSFSGDWYWVGSGNLTYHNWGPGEPGEVDEGQCALMSVKDSSECEWKDENCCKNVRAVCYRKPTLLDV